MRAEPTPSPPLLRRPPSRLLWLPDTPGACGYAVPFRSIMVHAVSTAPPRPCIFAQLEGGVPGEASAEEEEEEEEDACVELRLVPADESKRANPMPCRRAAVSRARRAQLTPSSAPCATPPHSTRTRRKKVRPGSQGCAAELSRRAGEEGEEDDMFFDGEEEDGQRSAALARLEALIVEDPTRFEDVSEE